MSNRTLRNLITVLALSVSASVALGQKPLVPTWEGARAELVNTKHTVYVVTIAHPKRRHTCRVDSIDNSEIVCTHAGRTTTFKAADVAALIFPGQHTPVFLWFASFAAAAGAATWGTVVLAPVCPPCAVATGITALFLYAVTLGSGMAGDGDSADTVLYLAPGQTLQVRLD